MIHSTSSLLKALEFAAEKHKTQRRKGSDDTPYINHPIQVANLLVSIGQETDGDLLIAAILHDTIEDTKTSYEEIVGLFGVEVANIVNEVTDDKTLKKHQRKQLQIEKAPHKSHKAKLLKIADKTCNIRDIVNHPPNWGAARKLEYLNWADQVVTALGITEHPLLDYFNSWLTKGRAEIKH